MEIIVFGNKDTRAAASKYIELMSLEGQGQSLNPWCVDKLRSDLE